MHESGVDKDTLAFQSVYLAELASLLYRLPSRSELNSCIAEDVFSSVPFAEGHPKTKEGVAILSSWSARNRSGLSEEEYEALASDYLYLFIGASAPKASLWESTYFNKQGLLFQGETLAVRSWYKRYGLMCERKNQEPDDNLALELLFCSRLSALALEAAERGDRDEASRVSADIAAFAVEHPARWVKMWSEKTRTCCKSDFYCGLALLVEGAVGVIAQRLQHV